MAALAQPDQVKQMIQSLLIFALVLAINHDREKNIFLRAERWKQVEKLENKPNLMTACQGSFSLVKFGKRLVCQGYDPFTGGIQTTE